MLEVLLAQLPVIQAPVYVCVQWMWVQREKDPFNPYVWCVKWMEKGK